MGIVLLIIGVLVVGYLLGKSSGQKASTSNTSRPEIKPIPEPETKPVSKPVVNIANEVVTVAKAKPNKKATSDDVLPANLVLTDEFKLAFDVMENSLESIFITGKAGTGKSTLLKYFRSKSKKDYVVLAPTGIAAINVQGQTIHSFFKFPPALITSHNVTYDPDRIELFMNLDMIVIDEISMVRSDMMDGIDLSLRKHRNSKLPFGGVQMVFIGDLYQLPPVVVGDDLKVYFSTTFDSEYFFSASVFKSYPFKKIELSKIFRQRDEQFINLLNNIRVGKSKQEDLNWLNKRVVPDFNPTKEDLFVTLSSTNAIADTENDRRLNELDGKQSNYIATIKGEFDKNAYPTSELLKLKPEAQVMTLKNDPGRRWVNGSIGKVLKLEEDTITIELNGKKQLVERDIWEVIEYKYNKEEKKIEPIVKGSFTQFPLKLAWAVTIHKSQGKTFDQVVIDLGKGAFAHGQTYVALSRCTTFEGIILKQNIRSRDIILDKKVLNFMQLVTNSKDK